MSWYLLSSALAAPRATARRPISSATTATPCDTANACQPPGGSASNASNDNGTASSDGASGNGSAAAARNISNTPKFTSGWRGGAGRREHRLKGEKPAEPPSFRLISPGDVDATPTKISHADRSPVER